MQNPDADTVGSLAEGLERALEESGWTARGLAEAAGLSADTVRNVTQGMSASLRGGRLDLIADLLGIDPGALSGEKPWPRKRLRRAPVVASGPRRGRGHRAEIAQAEIPQLDLDGLGSDLRAGSSTRVWPVPGELIDGRGVQTEDLVVVAAPKGVGRRIKAGDRIVVDVGHAARLATAAGIYLVFDGSAHMLASIRRGETVAGVEICGRVVVALGGM